MFKKLVILCMLGFGVLFVTQDVNAQIFRDTTTSLRAFNPNVFGGVRNEDVRFTRLVNVTDTRTGIVRRTVFQDVQGLGLTQRVVVRNDETGRLEFRNVLVRNNLVRALVFRNARNFVGVVNRGVVVGVVRNNGQRVVNDVRQVLLEALIREILD